jgi:molybdopterin converting factor small subunit
MKINLIAYGIAKDIFQARQLEITMKAGDSITTLKQHLFHLYPDLSGLKSISFAVGNDYQDDGYILRENDEVIVIPPVSGG